MSERRQPAAAIAAAATVSMSDCVRPRSYPVAGMPVRSTLRGATISFQVDSARLTGGFGFAADELALALLGQDARSPGSPARRART